MPFLTTAGSGGPDSADDGADAKVRAMYAEATAENGYLPNYVRTFSLRPEVYAAWDQLNASIKANADARRYRIATLAAARELSSSYCALAHGQVFVDHFPSDEEPAELTLRRLMGDVADPALDPVDAAVATLAASVARDANAITDDDIAPLRVLGFTDPEILDVILAAAARCFFSTVLDATGTQPDRAFAGVFDDETRAALTVGRPIADA